MRGRSGAFTKAERELLIRRIVVVERCIAGEPYWKVVELTMREATSGAIRYPQASRLDLHEEVEAHENLKDSGAKTRSAYERYQTTWQGRKDERVQAGTLAGNKKLFVAPLSGEERGGMKRDKFNLICHAVEFLIRALHRHAQAGQLEKLSPVIADFLGFDEPFDYDHPLPDPNPTDPSAGDAKPSPELRGYLDDLLDRTRLISVYPDQRREGLEAAGMEHDGLHVPLAFYRRIRKGNDDAEETDESARIVEERVDLRDALRRWSKLRIVGAPGAGKSSVLREVARAYARTALGKGLPETGYGLEADASGHIPVYVRLKDLAATVKTPWVAEDDLATLAARDVGPGDRPWVETALRSGRAILLLDGFDELDRSEDRSDLLGLIDRHKGRVILSSRPEALDSKSDYGFREPGGTTLFLSPLDSKRVRACVLNLYPKLADREDRIADLIDHIAKDPNAASLSANPLLLSFMVGVHAHSRTLPSTPSDLYQKIVMLIVEEANRRAEGSPEFKPLKERDVFFFLPALAAWMLCDREDRLFVTEETVVEWVQRLLPLHPVRARHNEDAEKWAKRLLEATGFFDRSEGRFSFVHRSFQEFFAGVYLADERADCPTRTPSSRIYEVRHKEEWRESYALGIGWLARKTKDPGTVKRVIDEGILGQASNGDDAFEPSLGESWLLRDFIESIRVRGHFDLLLGDEEEAIERVASAAKISDVRFFASNGLHLLGRYEKECPRKERLRDAVRIAFRNRKILQLLPVPELDLSSGDFSDFIPILEQGRDSSEAEPALIENGDYPFDDDSAFNTAWTKYGWPGWAEEFRKSLEVVEPRLRLVDLMDRGVDRPRSNEREDFLRHLVPSMTNEYADFILGKIVAHGLSEEHTWENLFDFEEAIPQVKLEEFYLEALRIASSADDREDGVPGHSFSFLWRARDRMGSASSATLGAIVSRIRDSRLPNTHLETSRRR